ncbi:MAG: glycerol-3-phosphate dehydrogenase/oxidase [Planctomycetota bacterium]|jgi:glycerol-3-phosphate dehydrogenase
MTTYPDRDAMLDRARARQETWDLVVIGGGATGLGIAIDASARGYEVLLLEGGDFANGTSSRSTKLIHGGVRYLQQGNVSLVMEALKERGTLRSIAPHVVHDLAFIVPSYEWWESPFYGIGLKVYDLLAGRYGFGRSSHLSRESVIQRIPTVERDGLRGGTLYYDGQFDDARLALNLAQTAAGLGGVLLNHAPVTALQKGADGVVTGVSAVDRESGETFEATGRVVINATGPFADAVRRLDDPDAKPMIAPSQGVHLVLDRSCLPGDAAIMVPRTDDGRVLFAIPWYDRVVVGTTDTPIEAPSLEPAAHPEEVAFILETADRYLEGTIDAGAVRSVFTGIRPLVRASDGENTSDLSRDHTVYIDPASGLVTVAGGKWTTYRNMAEDVVDHAAMLGQLEPRPCTTNELMIHGAIDPTSDELAFYGSDAAGVRSLMDAEDGGADRVHPDLPCTNAQVRWACRYEMARTVDDVLARRTRCLLFDARAAREAAADVAAIMAEELHRDAAWADRQVQAFDAIAAGYVWE